MNKPRDLPVLFQGDMVRAVLDDSKHLTSRVIKPQPFLCLGDYWTWHSGRKAVAGYKGQAVSDFCQELAAYARYQVGDHLWVRETWGLSTAADAVLVKDGVTPGDLPLSAYASLPIFYRADGEDNEVARWRSSIHMPRAASRINLEVTAVTVKRIQEISEEEARDEGILVNEWEEYYGGSFEKFTNYHDYSNELPFGCANARYSLQTLWDSINSTPKRVKASHGLDHYTSYPWDYQDNVAQISKHRGGTHVIYGNPFVFVYRFKRGYAPC